MSTEQEWELDDSSPGTGAADNPNLPGAQEGQDETLEGQPPVEGQQDGEPPVEGPPKTEFNVAADDLLDETLGQNDPDVLPPDPDAEVFTGVAEILKDQGFFSDLSEEDLKGVRSSDSLAEMLDKEVQARLSDRQKALQEYMNQGVPVSEVAKVDHAIQEAASITPDMITQNKELAKNLIVSELAQRGLDEGTIGLIYESMESKGIVEQEANKSLAARLQNLSGMKTQLIDKAKADKQAEIDSRKAMRDKIAEKLESSEVFGRKVTPTTVQKLKDLANKPVAYTQEGVPLNAMMKYQEDNPVDFEHKLTYLFAVTNGFKDLKAFDRSAESRISKSFRSAVSSYQGGSSAKTPTTNQGTKIDLETIDDIV